MRRKIIAANWKMNKTPSEAMEFMRAFKHKIVGINDRDIVVIPPAVNLVVLKDMLPENVKLGAQNVHFENSGAFTGELSVHMVKEAGATYVVIGHSERRWIFKEDDEMINKKVKKVIDAGLKPILCVGERLEHRQKGLTFAVIEWQVRSGLFEIAGEDVANMVIAYEPVWAIGTGLNAKVEDAVEAISFIRELIAKLYNREIANKIQIQYGGSVKPENVKGYLEREEIDGALVGGASLDPDKFYKIVKWEEQ